MVSLCLRTQQWLWHQQGSAASACSSKDQDCSMCGHLEKQLLCKFPACLFPMFTDGWVFVCFFEVMVVGFRHLYLLIINSIIIATWMSRIPVRWLSDLGLSCWGPGNGFNFIILLLLLPITAKEKWTPSKLVCSYSPIPPQCRFPLCSFTNSLSFPRGNKWKKMCTETANGEVIPLRKDTGTEVPNAKDCRTESLEQDHFWQ